MMNQHGGHKIHLALMAGIVIVALLVGVGAGGALALALLGCTVMMVAMVWLMVRSTGRITDQPAPGRAARPRDDRSLGIR